MAGATCLKSLANVKCGTGPAEIANGTDLYAHLYEAAPQVKHYFKGNENLTPAEVKTSEHFKKQGQVLLGAIHHVAELYDDKAKFKAYCDEIIDRHVKINVNLEPSLWSAFWPLFLGFLEKKTTVDEATKKAWLEVGKAFADECNAHLKAIGKPHC